MSFFKKLTDEFKELKSKFDDEPQEEKKEKKEEKKDDTKAVDSTQVYNSHNASQAPFDHSAQHQQHYPLQNEQQYAPPPAGSHSQPPLPPGWSTQFDQSSQRWYYIEQATGRTQWDAPVSHNAGYGAPPPSGYGAMPPSGYGGAPGHSGPGHEASRGHDGSSGAAGGFYNSYGSAMPPGAPGPHGGGQYGHDQNAAQYYGDVKQAEKDGEKIKDGEKKDKDKDGKKKDKDNGTRNMMLAGAGGLAMGGVAGAMIAGDSDSDDGHHAPAQNYGAQPSYGAPAAAPMYAQDPSYGAPAPAGQDTMMAPPPAHDSDAESLHEAQQDYADAQRAAADSDASSSEEEELREAREELEEEHEEYYDD